MRSLAAFALAAVLSVAGAAAAAPDAPPMTLGSAKAPVTVVEYASVGCPHCADWANTVFPEFKAKYIDTGKVRFELHEMLTGSPQLAVLGFLAARCAAPEHYFEIVDGIFAEQDFILENGVDVLAAVAGKAGVSREAFDACLRDPAAREALFRRTQADAEAAHIASTPTFIIGGEHIEGAVKLEVLDAAIERARKARR